ncbi:MAG: hypothetical protein WA030_02050 [Candidatus Microsaccharimonas sp.]
MYSGTTIGKRSGHVIGVHQRIDRIARRHVKQVLPSTIIFPSITEILHFEGNNGPDGIKRKSPSKDEPWHYINPEIPHDRALIDMILDHQVNLATALKKKNHERAAFEAAWMAHAIVDGLTPAHHIPFGDKIEELFGMPHIERKTVKQKNIIKGSNRRDTLSRNWQYWGKNGLMMSHFWFEIGVSMAIIGTPYKKDIVSDKDLEHLKTDGYENMFRGILKDVYDLKLYDTYLAKGWTRPLGQKVRSRLTPLIIKAVVLGWYVAAEKASR